MKAVVQRVSQASVSVNGEATGAIGVGLVVLVAAHRDDTEANARKLADRIWGLRIFNDQSGKMNLSWADSCVMFGSDMSALGVSPKGDQTTSETDTPLSGETPEPQKKAGILCISNFTIYGETSKNRRPSFVESAPYDQAEKLYNSLLNELKQICPNVQSGRFGADMQVSLVNEGPVTIIVEG